MRTKNRELLNLCDLDAIREFRIKVLDEAVVARDAAQSVIDKMAFLENSIFAEKAKRVKDGLAAQGKSFD